MSKLKAKAFSSQISWFGEWTAFPRLKVNLGSIAYYISYLNDATKNRSCDRALLWLR
ncbi:hypothetical protein QQ054_20360 [Oscillatoria amoena NRMC-F 0135]|nr:hypothetical protein [Geitlerinema splendidum]MDL5048366.1 hypothetical protein [Oscillatoria amoena NRMC-F 0135]